MVKRTLAVLSLLFALATGSYAQKAAAPVTFDVATIRSTVKDSETLKFEAVGTTGLTGNHLSVLFLIQFAYELKPYEVDIPKGLGWIDTMEFDINAKAATDHPLSYEELKPMVQNLLEERFHLKFHRGTREMKGYNLVVAKGGSKLVTTSEHAKMGYIMQNGIQMTGSQHGLACGGSG